MRQHLRSANRHLLAVPRFRLNTYIGRSWAFSVAGPMAWNSLPDFIPGFNEQHRLFLGVYLKRTYSHDISASSALGILNDYALYNHALTHSHSLPTHRCAEQSDLLSLLSDNRLLVLLLVVMQV